MSDCTHDRIKCMKCFRDLRDISRNPPGSDRDEAGYEWAKFDYGDAQDTITITKGPYIFEFRTDADSIWLLLWDNTDPDGGPVLSEQCHYADCLEPRRSDLIEDPRQQVLAFDPDINDIPDTQKSDKQIIEELKTQLSAAIKWIQHDCPWEADVIQEHLERKGYE